MNRSIIRFLIIISIFCIAVLLSVPPLALHCSAGTSLAPLLLVGRLNESNPQTQNIEPKLRRGVVVASRPAILRIEVPTAADDYRRYITNAVCPIRG